MSCPASTVLPAAAANGYESPDDRMLWLAMIGSLLPGAGNPTWDTIKTQAAANGIFDMEDRMLMLAIAGFLCGP